MQEAFCISIHFAKDVKNTIEKKKKNLKKFFQGWNGKDISMDVTTVLKFHWILVTEN